VKIIFDEFTVQNKALPARHPETGELMVAVRIQEATAGVGPDGETGVVSTGLEFHGVVTAEVAKMWAIDLAIAAGAMQDLDKPEIADLSAMRDEIEKKKRRPRR